MPYVTNFEYVKGKGKWFHIQTPNQFGDYKVTLYPDQPSLAKILEWKGKGMKNKLRKDDDGENIDFKRPTQKMLRGKIVAYAAPDVLDNNGIPMRGIPIGNGSDVTLKLEVYPYHPLTDRSKTELAARLVAIKVHDLVPYQPTDLTPEQEKMTRGLAEQTAPDPF